MRGRIEKQIQHEAKKSAVFVLRHPLSAVISVHMSVSGALTGILLKIKFSLAQGSSQ